MIKNRGLGKGLTALFAETGAEYERVEGAAAEPTPQPAAGAGTVAEIPLRLIAPNPDQPRKHFDEEKLAELAESIRAHGVIQPLVLNRHGDRYLIIAGERRYRASKLAGLATVPAVVRELSEREITEIAIVENLQREDLNPVEAAMAIRDLMEQFGLTQEQVAARIGKSRPAIANLLRLLSLSKPVLNLVREGRLTAGHARALVVVTDANRQIDLAERACDNKMSVRQLEEACRQLDNDVRRPVKKSGRGEISRELRSLVGSMQTVFGTRVTVSGSDSQGKICIEYFSGEDLDRLYDCIEKLK